MTTSLVALELDALREVANIATARAARALADLTRREVWISPPSVHWTPGPFHDPETPPTNEALVAVGTAVRGSFQGSLLFLVTANSARELSRILIGSHSCGDPADALVRSCIAETANILGGSYLTALSSLTGCTYDLGTPNFGHAPETKIWSDLQATGEWPVAGISVETELYIGDGGRALPYRLLLLGDRGAIADALCDLKAWS